MTERRLSPRVPLNLLVQFRLASLDEFMRDYAVNISSGGMFIRTRDPHPAGSNIYIQLSLSDGSTLIEGLGKVVHVNPPSHPVPGMGVEFVNLDAASRQLIDRIIQERLEELADADAVEGA